MLGGNMGQQEKDPMDSGNFLTSYALRILKNNAERNQQAMKTIGNAEMMRYSPWTTLQSNAAAQQNQNLEFNPQADMAKQTAQQLGSLTSQGGKDANLMQLLKAAFGGG